MDSAVYSPANPIHQAPASRGKAAYSAQAHTTPTMAKAMEDLLKIIYLRNSQSTWVSYESHARYFTRLWGPRQIHTITKHEVEDWAHARKKEVAIATVRRQLSLLRYAMNWAQECDPTLNFFPNPASGLRIKLKPARRIRLLSREEENRLRAAYLAKDPGLGALEWTAVRFALLTGLRRCEQLALTVNCIQGDLLLVPPAKCDERTVPLLAEAQQIAEIWIDMAREMGSSFIFWPWWEGSQHNRYKRSVRYYQEYFGPLCTKAEVKVFQWRDLRRTFACRLLDEGVSVFDVMKLLGHTNPEHTMRYCCVTTRQLRAAIQKMK